MDRLAELRAGTRAPSIMQGAASTLKGSCAAADRAAMPLSPRQKHALRRELRDLLFRVATAGGAMLGLLWALNRPEPARPVSCAPDDKTDGIAACVNDAFLASLLPYLGGMVVGAIAGALLAAVVVRLVLPPWRSARRRAGAGRRWIRARYAGRCDGCRRPIAVGDRILHEPGEALCEGCDG